MRLPKWVHIMQIVFTINSLLLYSFIYYTTTIPNMSSRKIREQVIFESIEGQASGSRLKFMRVVDDTVESINVEKTAHQTWITDNDKMQKHFTSDLKFLLVPKVLLCMRFARTDNDSLRTVVFLKSRPHEYYQRAAIRATWGAHFKGNIVFVMARSKLDDRSSNVIEPSILFESERHSDILLVDFQDTYLNLSLKSLSILKWITTFCKPLKGLNSWFVQVDTDTILIPSNLIKFLQNVSRKRGVLYGKCWTKAKVRRTGKWAVSKARYNREEYPTYCAGALFIMSTDVPYQLMSFMHSDRRYFNIDDVFFTGILAEKAGIARIDRRDLFCYFQEHGYWLVSRGSTS